MILGHEEAELSKQARATTKVRDSKRHGGLTTRQPKILADLRRGGAHQTESTKRTAVQRDRSSDRVNLHDGLYIVYLRETEKRNSYRPVGSKSTTKSLEDGKEGSRRGSDALH
ncbi:hypothetical protein Rs2_13698 [Raphanus sativus]|nr:hypothetical protein Rs2_13698 [Raphanus sativus]